MTQTPGTIFKKCFYLPTIKIFHFIIPTHLSEFTKQFFKCNFQFFKICFSYFVFNFCKKNVLICFNSYHFILILFFFFSNKNQSLLKQRHSDPFSSKTKFFVFCSFTPGSCCNFYFVSIRNTDCIKTEHLLFFQIS